MIIESSHDAADKKRWRVVRTDNYTDIAGEIDAANETTGDCTMHEGDKTTAHHFGAGGLRIVRRTHGDRQRQRQRL